MGAGALHMRDWDARLRPHTSEFRAFSFCTTMIRCRFSLFIVKLSPQKLVKHHLALARVGSAEAQELRMLAWLGTAEIDTPQGRDAVGDHRIAEVSNHTGVMRVFDEEPRREVFESIEVVLMDGPEGFTQRDCVERGDAPPFIQC